MATNQEKIKAFLNDEEFMEKVSKGTATAETYRKELEKIDINLSTKEATKVKKVTDQILQTPENKLDDVLLEQVSGGAPSARVVVGGIVTGVSVAGTIGCGIARFVMQKKLNDAIKKENLADIKKYNSLARKLEWASLGSMVGVGFGVSIIGPEISLLIDRNKSTNANNKESKK